VTAESNTIYLDYEAELLLSEAALDRHLPHIVCDRCGRAGVHERTIILDKATIEIEAA